MGIYTRPPSGADRRDGEGETPPTTLGEEKVPGGQAPAAHERDGGALGSAVGVADEVYARVLLLVARAEELTQRLDLAAELPGSSSASDAPMLCFGSVEAWVREYFLPMFSWRVDGQRSVWCPQWWQHAEAIWRLELLWRAWETARLQPTGMSTWSTELDWHLRELLGDQGPFRHCQVEGERVARHINPEPAIAEPAPAGWWELY